MPTQNGFFAGGNGTNDPTGSTCAYFTGNPGGNTPGLWDPACTSDSQPCRRPAERLPGRERRRRLPGAGHATGAGGCTLNAAASSGVLPLSVLNQSLARILYQEQRFGMLGCDPVADRVLHEPRRRRRRPHRHRAAAARRRRPARDEVRRRGDRREVLRGGRDAAQERRQRAAAHGLRPRRRHPRHRRRARTTRSPTRPTRPRPASSTATRSTRWSSSSSSAATRTRSRSCPPTTRPAQPVPCKVTNIASPTGAAPAAAPPAACNATSGLQRASGATVATVANDQVDSQVDYTTRLDRRPARRRQGVPVERLGLRADGGHVHVGAPVQRAERERHVRLRQRREPGDRRARDAHAGERAEHLRGDDARDADERRATRRRC